MNLNFTFTSLIIFPTLKMEKRPYLGKKGYTIPKSILSENEYLKIKKDLTIKPYSMGGDVPSYFLFRESPKKLYVPRMYGMKILDSDPEKKICEGEDIDLPFTGALREYQQTIIQAYIEEAGKSGCGLLEIYAGAGKTVMALKIISELKKKTLIVVHKEFLVTQWIERIQQFLPLARVGRIQGNTFDVEGKDIVLGMLQSLSMRDYHENQFSSFGMTIVDECFPYDTEVLTEDGFVKIGLLYERWNTNDIIPQILSYNDKLNIFEYNALRYSWKKNTEELVEIHHSNSCFQCTQNHKIRTSKGYKKARYLKENDILYCYSKEEPEDPIYRVLHYNQLQIILGSWLSGKCYIHRLQDKTYYVNFYDKNKEYLLWKMDVFHETKYTYCSNTQYYSFSTPVFHSDLVFDYESLSSMRSVLDVLDIPGLAVWFMDKGYYNYATQEVFLSLKYIPSVLHGYIVEKFDMYIRDVEIDCATPISYYVFNNRTLPTLLHSLQIYLVPSAPIYYELESYYTSSLVYSWNTPQQETYTSLVDKVIQIKKTEDVYDIEVSQNHNYIIKAGYTSGVIVHNCHHIGAEVFCRALFKIVTPYMLGLSATMTRKDGLSKVFKMFLGDVVYKYKRQGDDNVVIKVLQYKNSDEDFNEEVYNYRGQVHYSIMIKKICEFNPRTEFILQVLRHFLEKECEEKPDNRENIKRSQVMILAHNKSILKYLYDAIQHRGYASVGYYLGGMKEKNLKETETKKIVIATYAMAEEALDIKTLSCLFLVSPRTDVTQAVGRILRMKHEETVVYDIVDQHPIFQRQFIKRRNLYTKWKYKIIETDNEKYFKNEWTTMYDPSSNEKYYKKKMKEKDSGFNGKCILRIS